MSNETESLPVGTHVRHYGTKRWGVIKEAVPQRDRSFEYRIERDLPLLSYERPETWWASYHIDRVRSSNAY